MAVRKHLTHDQKTREKIQTSQIINRLTDHILKDTEMKASQVRAAEVLLNKTLPNLQSATIDQNVTVDGLETLLTQIASTRSPPSERTS